MKRKIILSNIEISTFCEQISLLIDAGFTPYDSIQILIQDINNESGKKLLVSISDFLRSGCHFSEAIERTELFPSYFSHMIKLGEESGKLDVVIHNLYQYYDREFKISTSIKNSLRYPIIMIFMMLIVITILLTKVLPIFQQVFIQLGSELTGIGYRLMLFGKSLNQLSAIFLLLAILITFCILIFNHFPSSQKKIYNFFTKFPLSKNFYISLSYARLANGLYLSLSSGLDIYKSFDLITNIIDNPIVSKQLVICREQLQSGLSFPDALSSSNIFSNLYIQMLSVAYKTGSTDKVLKQIAIKYDELAQNKLHDFLSSLEPTLVIIFSAIVGTILLSVIVPLIGIMSSIC